MGQNHTIHRKIQIVNEQGLYSCFSTGQLLEGLLK